MNRIAAIFMNRARLEKGPRYRITEQCPVFSWAVAAPHRGAAQAAYSLQVRCGSRLLWHTGWVETDRQEAAYDGELLPVEQELTIRLLVRDDRGDVSEPHEESFYVSGLLEPFPGWIAASVDMPGKAAYFRREFRLSGEVESAVLYACGLGYHKLYLNGEELDQTALDPVHADYTKSCYYTMLPGVENQLKPGTNCLGIVLGEGWRRATGVCTVDPNLKTVPFFGQPQLSARLRIRYADGRTETLDTDESWTWSHGAIVYNDLFNGETYDAGSTRLNWTLPSFSDGFSAVASVPSPGGKARPAMLEPIAAQEMYAPRCITPIDENTWLVDFGINIAGICCLRLPKHMEPGQTITLQHMEMLKDDGTLYMEPARSARQTDTYIASGDGRDLEEWQPLFTYHGFRYVQISGCPFLSKEDIRALSLYSDVRSGSVFTCGSALVNAIQDNIVRTEKNNLHGLLTDCPQRDERMGWLNDATVRFEETPYNFRVARLFPKVIRDILDTQGEDGSITCTAPFVFGCRPADPVCSSFLVAGLEAYLHTGNREILCSAYEGFAKWEACLSAHADGHIVGYSYYGDWAAPEYACSPPEFPCSAVTPGDFMSTGYYYYNAVLLARFAGILGRKAEQKTYANLAEEIRAAMLRRWWDGETGRMATGSQACQSFALWLGILPEDKRALAAQRLHEDLVKNAYRITTGNLCTRYLFDMLTVYGYLEDAWTLITREEYPSLGYMIQQEATTIWERFELKKNAAMNSHDHPMYGAVGYWFYAYLAGIQPMGPGYESVHIRPYFPQKLHSVNATVDTPKGDLTVRWIKRFGKTHLYVMVPVGVKATISFNAHTQTVGSGFWKFEADCNVQ